MGGVKGAHRGHDKDDNRKMQRKECGEINENNLMDKLIQKLACKTSRFSTIYIIKLREKMCL